jgi:acetyl esterase/lipase
VRRLVRATVLCALAILISLTIGAAVKRPVDLLNWVTPRSSYQLEADIAYGDLPRQRLDVYHASEPRTTPAPVIVFFYGGAWSSGDRADYRFVGQALARAGFTVVIPDYRLRPEVAFPAFLEDGAKALRWTQDHVAGEGGFFLMGHSAGAYNAMMLALDRRYGAAAGFDAARIRGVVGLAGPYDFELKTPSLQAVFGAAPNLRETQPIAFAAGGAPPILLVTGDADETVNPENSRSLARALTATGSPVVMREVPGLGHLGVLLHLSPLWAPRGALREEIIRFLIERGGG